VVFDLTHRPSFISVGKWIEDVRSARGIDSLVILAGNKSDLEEERAISNEEAEDKAAQYNVHYFETSAFTGKNIQKLFIEAARSIPQVSANLPDTSKLGETVHVTP
jgi:GTPase SAR1 family protein